MQQKFQQDITIYTIHFTTLEPTRTITKWIAVPVALNKEEVKSYPMKSDEVKALCIHICHDCNMRCRYCFADEGAYHAKRESMSLETAKKAGMTTVGVYDASSDDYADQIRSIVDRYLVDYAEYTP